MTRIKNIVYPLISATRRSKRCDTRVSSPTPSRRRSTCFMLSKIPIRPVAIRSSMRFRNRYFDQVEKEARKQLETLLTKEERTRYGAVLVHRTGAPAQEILDYVRAQGHIDLIAMATHGRGGVARPDDGQRRRQGCARGSVPGPDAAVARGVDRADQSCGLTSGPPTPLGSLREVLSSRRPGESSVVFHRSAAFGVAPIEARRTERKQPCRSAKRCRRRLERAAAILSWDRPPR